MKDNKTDWGWSPWSSGLQTCMLLLLRFFTFFKIQKKNVKICRVSYVFSNYGSHCMQSSHQLPSITASIVQSSVLGPASYLVTASDLQPLSSSNVILKYADDTYLIILVSSQSTCQLEIQLWAEYKRRCFLRLTAITAMTTADNVNIVFIGSVHLVLLLDTQDDHLIMINEYS